MRTIQQLQQLISVKASTIRVWEQRYAPFATIRTSTNQRLYGEEDIYRALYLALLTRQHYNIGEVAACSLPELAALSAPVLAQGADWPTLIDGLLLAILERDSSGYAAQLTALVGAHGGRMAVEQLILPLLSRLQGLGGQELTDLGEWSLALTQLMTCLNEWIQQVPAPRSRTASRYLLFLPVGEGQPIYLRLAHYLLAVQGCLVIYLGENVTQDELSEAYRTQKPTHLVSWLTRMPLNQVQAYVNELGQRYPKAQLLLGGERVVGQDLELPDQVRLSNTVLQLAQ
jgi:MerR family transcriptional regulator, light-induced transcriptional regulator